MSIVIHYVTVFAKYMCLQLFNKQFIYLESLNNTLNKLISKTKIKYHFYVESTKKENNHSLILIISNTF